MKQTSIIGAAALAVVAGALFAQSEPRRDPPSADGIGPLGTNPLCDVVVEAKERRLKEQREVIKINLRTQNAVEVNGRRLSGLALGIFSTVRHQNRSVTRTFATEGSGGSVWTTPEQTLERKPGYKTHTLQVLFVPGGTEAVVRLIDDDGEPVKWTKGNTQQTKEWVTVPTTQAPTSSTSGSFVRPVLDEYAHRNWQHKLLVGEGAEQVTIWMLQ